MAGYRFLGPLLQLAFVGHAAEACILLLLHLFLKVSFSAVREELDKNKNMSVGQLAGRHSTRVIAGAHTHMRKRLRRLVAATYNAHRWCRKGRGG